MFLSNKYTNCYFRIINKTQSRTDLIGYSEKHHIIPKSLGGYSGKNLVKLTAREHFVCHLLLVKMTTSKNRAKMIYALLMLYHTRKNPDIKINNRTYEKLRKEFSEQMSGTHHTVETKQKISIANSGEKCFWFGKHLSEETKQKMSIAKRGKSRTKETKQKISIANSGENNPKNKYIFTLSDGRNYWTDLTINQRSTICLIFRIKQPDTITMSKGSLKGITITKVLK